jgi:hypothetical protein
MLARKGYPPALAVRAVREELAAAGEDDAEALTAMDAADEAEAMDGGDRLSAD